MVHTPSSLYNALAILAAHFAVQSVAHAVACFASVVTDNLIYIDAVSGLSLFLSSAVFVSHHARHPLIGVLLCVWSLRLSIFFIWRHAALGRVRARCVPENLLSTYAFAVSRLIWSLAVLLTMHATPTMDAAIRIELTCAALAALAFETYADAELLLFRIKDRGHTLYTKGLWAWSRHPNMFGELVFQVCVFLLVVDWTFASVTSGAACIVTATGILALPGGIATLEDRAQNTWGATDVYRTYVRTTPRLLPYGPCVRLAQRNAESHVSRSAV